MRKAFPILILFILTLYPGLTGKVGAQSLNHEVQQCLRTRIEAMFVGMRIVVRDELIYASVVLHSFYEDRTFEPVWSKNGVPTSQVNALLKAISGADIEGLDPGHYHLSKISDIVGGLSHGKRKRTGVDPGRLTDLDLLLTDAFLLHGSHLLGGE